MGGAWRIRAAESVDKCCRSTYAVSRRTTLKRSSIVRLYDLGILMLAAGIAAAVALVVAAQIV